MKLPYRQPISKLNLGVLANTAAPSPQSQSVTLHQTTFKAQAQISNMTVATFRYIDPASSQSKPWSKVDGPGTSFPLVEEKRTVHNIRGREDDFSMENCGFAICKEPTAQKFFTDERAIREHYYAEVEGMLKKKLTGVKKVVIFDHTIRRRVRDAPRQPVQQVHVDQTPSAAEVRVRRHVPANEAELLLKGRHQIINVWRPIENPASDFPLAVIDWRTTDPADLKAVDLLYPRRDYTDSHEDDDRGKEKLPDPDSYLSTDGYEVKGETFHVVANEKHQFYYVKDMVPDEVMLFKSFDSRGEGMSGGIPGVAVGVPHTAFEDPETPADAPGRQSIEVRCLVFYH